MDTPIKVREIQVPEDYSPLAGLFNSIMIDPTTPEALEKEDRHIPIQANLTRDAEGKLTGFGRKRYIAESSEGKMIGFAAVWRAPWTPPGILSTQFCVHSKYRNQGIGSLLLKTLEDWGRQQGAFLLMSEIKDWIPNSLSFIQNRGFILDAHVYELILDLNAFKNPWEDQGLEADISIQRLSELSGDESEIKLYELYSETIKDNPGQVGELADFQTWKEETIMNDEMIFIARKDDQFIGVTTLVETDQEGILYTDYTGVIKEFRGKGIARSLKLKSIAYAQNRGVHTMITESEANNTSMQMLNKKLGFIQGKGHYRVTKELEQTLSNIL